MSVLEKPIHVSELRELLTRGKAEVINEVDEGFKERGSSLVRDIKFSSLGLANLMASRIDAVLSESPTEIKNTEDLSRICTAVNQALAEITDALENKKPECTGRGGTGKKEGRAFRTAIKMFRDAVRRARSALNERYDLNTQEENMPARLTDETGMAAGE